MPRLRPTNPTYDGNTAVRNGKPPAAAFAQESDSISPAALAGYYRRHRCELHSYAYTLVRDPYLAEDMVQQALVNTIASIGNGSRIEVKDLPAWLHRCIRNLSIDHHRTTRAEPLDPLIDVDDPPFLESAASCAEEADLRESWRMVTRAVAILPPHFQKVFILAEVRGLTYPEIAAALDRSVHSVRQTLSRARHHVRDIVGRDNVALPHDRR